MSESSVSPFFFFFIIIIITIIVGPAFEARAEPNAGCLSQNSSSAFSSVSITQPFIQITSLLFSNQIISGHTIVFGREDSPERQHIKAKTGSSRRGCGTATRCTTRYFSPTRLPAAERIKRKLQWHTQHRGIEPHCQRQGAGVITLFMAVK